MSKTPNIPKQLINKRPVLKSAYTTAVFQTSTKLWSDPTVTWNDINVAYGGSDPKQEKGPVLKTINYPSS